MKESKNEFREKIRDLELENAKLKIEKRDLSKQIIEDLENQKKAIEEQHKEIEYQKFIANNGEYLKRFIKEYLEENLSINLTASYNEELGVSLILENKNISFSEDTIIHYDNPSLYC